MSADRAARQNCGVLRLNCPDRDVRIVLAQDLADAGDGTAGADAGAESVDRSADLGEANKNSDLTRSPSPEKSTLKHRFRCKICGYVHEAESLPADFTCPLCSAPASEFEEIL